MSFNSGRFPSAYKTGHVIPLLKKAGLDPEDASNYRPITNLTNISKLIERLVLSRIKTHVCDSPNFSRNQSAFRTGHSTETALLKICDDLNVDFDDRKCNFLLSLDISAAFDTILHDKLLSRLQSDFGFTGMALQLLQSYLCNRQCYIAMGDSRSAPWACHQGVPQGSVLGPLLFSLYVSPISRIFAKFGVCYHQYADDIQLYLGVKPSMSPDLKAITQCIDSVIHWFLLNGLLLNPNKTEAIAFGTRTQLAKLDKSHVIPVGDANIPCHDSVKILGVVLDSTLSMDSQVNAVVKSCNYHIRALRHVRKRLNIESAKTIACGLVTSRLDYCNSLLYGTSERNLHKLQCVQNSLARVVLQQPYRASAQPLLRKLHWLPVAYRIKYKVAAVTYNTLTRGQPAYLQSSLQRYSQSRNLRSNDQNLLVAPRRSTNAAARGFSSSGPHIWNCLSPFTRSSTSHEMFKSRLKCEFFNDAFSR
jgi:hypothetical protein